MIAIMKETDYMKKPTFLKNTWAAFKEVYLCNDAACSVSVHLWWDSNDSKPSLPSAVGGSLRSMSVSSTFTKLCCG